MDNERIDEIDADIRWAETRLALEHAGACEPITDPQHMREWLGRYVRTPEGCRMYVGGHRDGKLMTHPPGRSDHIVNLNPVDLTIWTDDTECDHEHDPTVEIEGDDGDMIMRFKAACIWGFCAKCCKRILIVDDTGTFAEDEL